MDQELLYQEGVRAMTKTTKIWPITATSLVLIGCVLFAGVMSMLGWDFMKLSTVTYETNTYEIGEVFDRISMNTDNADVVFVLSNDGKCKVECYEREKAKHTATVKDGMLTIELIDNRTVYDYVGLNFGSPKITLYLPSSEYTSLFIKEYTGDVEIPKNFTFKDVDISLSTGDINFCASASDTVKMKTSTGDIRVESISVGGLELAVTTGKVTVTGVSCKRDVAVSVSTGKVCLTDIVCKNVVSDGNTGDISLQNVIATEKFSIERNTGDVILERSDADEIIIKTDTGSVHGTLLSDKVFITESDTGSINVPDSVTGGKCEIITDTGDVNIFILGKAI